MSNIFFFDDSKPTFKNLWLLKDLAGFTSDPVRNYNLWSCQKVCEALTFLLDNILLDLALNYINKL